MRGYGLAYIYEVLLPEVSSNILAYPTGLLNIDFCFDLQFYTRMERQEVVSCTGSASSDLAKPGDDRFHDAVDTDSDDNEGTCACYVHIIIKNVICYISCKFRPLHDNCNAYLNIRD